MNGADYTISDSGKVSDSGRCLFQIWEVAIFCIRLSAIMRTMKADNRKRILISVPMLALQHRQGLEGILQYVKDHRTTAWDTYIEAEALDHQLNLSKVKCDGILAFITSDKARKRILAAKVPAVLYEPFKSVAYLKKHRQDYVTSITSDFAEEGRVAARYFIGRHFRNFAYVGSANKYRWIDEQRQVGFSDEVNRHGFQCITFPEHKPSSANDNDRSRLSEWLHALPHGTGIFCVRDVRALDVISAAAANGIDVPRHVAILGFDDDELLCRTCTPQLSSIYANVQALGYEVAHLLDLLMSGNKGNVIEYRPALSVVTRASSDIDAIGDPFVAKAISWIQTKLAENIGIDSVAEGIGCSTKFLQERFRKSLGCSIGKEIRRQRLEKAMQMIKASGKDLSLVAAACGFSNSAHLCTCIRDATGLTPTQINLNSSVEA